jgi:hypothetical protein
MFDITTGKTKELPDGVRSDSELAPGYHHLNDGNQPIFNCQGEYIGMYYNGFLLSISNVMLLFKDVIEEMDTDNTFTCACCEEIFDLKHEYKNSGLCDSCSHNSL